MSGARTDKRPQRPAASASCGLSQPEAAAQEEQVAVRAFEFDAAGKKARIQLENLGPNLGRVLQVTCDGRSRHQRSRGGFPLFPRSRRWTEVAWDRSQRLRLG